MHLVIEKSVLLLKKEATWKSLDFSGVNIKLHKSTYTSLIYQKLKFIIDCLNSINKVYLSHFT